MSAHTRATSILFWLVFALSLVVLFSPKVPSEHGVYGIDKVVHGLLFAALAGSTRLRFGRGLVLVLLYAPVSEVLQAVLPIGRDGNVPDALADAVGASIGWCASLAWTRRDRRVDR